MCHSATFCCRGGVFSLLRVALQVRRYVYRRIKTTEAFFRRQVESTRNYSVRTSNSCVLANTYDFTTAENRNLQIFHVRILNAAHIFGILRSTKAHTFLYPQDGSMNAVRSKFSDLLCLSTKLLKPCVKTRTRGHLTLKQSLKIRLVDARDFGSSQFFANQPHKIHFEYLILIHVR
jgi:hypothetical protein